MARPGARPARARGRLSRRSGDGRHEGQPACFRGRRGRCALSHAFTGRSGAGSVPSALAAGTSVSRRRVRNLNQAALAPPGAADARRLPSGHLGWRDRPSVIPIRHATPTGSACSPVPSAESPYHAWSEIRDATGSGIAPCAAPLAVLALASPRRPRVRREHGARRPGRERQACGPGLETLDLKATPAGPRPTSSSAPDPTPRPRLHTRRRCPTRRARARSRPPPRSRRPKEALDAAR